jgi:signal transduction histidine kinase
MNKISNKLIVLLILSALVPMSLFGIMAVWTARETASRIVAEENLEVAKRAAQQIEQYITHSIAVLEALAQNLAKTDLLDWQKERIVKNYTLEFEQFQSIDLTDRQGQTIATSRLNATSSDIRQDDGIQTALSGKVYRSEVFISKSFAPSMIIAVPLRALGEIQGVVQGEVNLIEMWRLVDSIRIGEEGYAFVVSKGGLLIAHGKGASKERVLKQERIGHLPIVRASLEGKEETFIYQDEEGVEQIGVSVPIQNPGWGLVIEQPTREAYAAGTRLTYQLSALVAIFLFLMIIIGTAGGRHYIVAPIRELIQGTRAVGGGNLANKVKILSDDEFQELGEAFNVMTDRLSALKEDIRRNERAAFLGKIAGGLVHDLKHPIKNLENSSLLMIQKFNDPKVRELFSGVAKRELADLNRFLDDLLHLARPITMRPVSLSLSSLVKDLLESFRMHPQCWVEEPASVPVDQVFAGKVRISSQINPPDLKIMADRFSFERVLKNLMMNAIEAMPRGGMLTITARSTTNPQYLESYTEILISDTGGGIPPDRLNNLFVDYTTTKRKGIGLGLAICKKIVEEHKATIRAESRLNMGTTFILRFPFSG